MTTQEDILSREATLITDIQKEVDEALDRVLPVALNRAERRALKGKPFLARVPMRLSNRTSNMAQWAKRDGRMIQQLASEKLAALGSSAKVRYIARSGWTNNIVEVYLTESPYNGSD